MTEQNPGTHHLDNIDRLAFGAEIAVATHIPDGKRRIQSTKLADILFQISQMQKKVGILLMAFDNLAQGKKNPYGYPKSRQSDGYP